MSAFPEFKKAGTVFTPPHTVDKREVFEKEVEPLVRAAVEKIKELGMPFVFGVGTAYSAEDGGEINHLTAYGHGEDQYMPPAIAMAAIALDSDHAGCLSCFIKEAVASKVVDAPTKVMGGHHMAQIVQAHKEGVDLMVANQGKPITPEDAAKIKDLKKDIFGQN